MTTFVTKIKVLVLRCRVLLAVLVYSGCHNKIPQTGWLKEQKFISHSGGWEVKAHGACWWIPGDSPHSGLQVSAFSLCSCGVSWLPVWVQRVSILVSLPFLIRVLALLIPPLWPLLTFIPSSQAMSPNTVTLWVRASPYEFWRDTVQSIAVAIFWVMKVFS